VKNIATVLRIEENLKTHLAFTGERRKMRQSIARAKAFASGCEGIAQTEAALIEQEYADQKAKEKSFKPRVQAVSDNLKFGRGKASTANAFKERAA